MAAQVGELWQSQSPNEVFYVMQADSQAMLSDHMQLWRQDPTSVSDRIVRTLMKKNPLVVDGFEVCWARAACSLSCPSTLVITTPCLQHSIYVLSLYEQASCLSVYVQQQDASAFLIQSQVRLRFSVNRQV
jgi:hypothetical protein